jgi:hypothetical protein
VVASLVIAAGYTLLVSSLVYWVGGWGLGQRHFAPAMPFLVLPLGILLERLLDTGRRLRAAAVLGLGSASVLITGMASAFFPLTPDAVQNPFFGIMLPLWGKGYGPYSWGTDLGLSPAAGFVPLMVLFMAVALFIPLAIGGSLRQRLKGLLVAGLVTASVFAAWSLVPVHTWTESQGVVAELERIYEPKPRLVVPTTFVPGRLP